MQDLGGGLRGNLVRTGVLERIWSETLHRRTDGMMQSHPAQTGNNNNQMSTTATLTTAYW